MSEMQYIRVGTSYFKKVKAPTISGDYNEILVSWNIDTIKHDYGKTFVADIPKYDGFTCIPSHTNFRQICSGFYNKYSQLRNKPKIGSIEVSKLFVKHIFSDQLELGLDYLHLLFQKPVQILLILCLVSKERSTGKTTFLKWLESTCLGAVFSICLNKVRLLFLTIERQLIPESFLKR